MESFCEWRPAPHTADHDLAETLLAYLTHNASPPHVKKILSLLNNLYSLLIYIEILSFCKYWFISNSESRFEPDLRLWKVCISMKNIDLYHTTKQFISKTGLFVSTTDFIICQIGPSHCPEDYLSSSVHKQGIDCKASCCHSITTLLLSPCSALAISPSSASSSPTSWPPCRWRWAAPADCCGAPRGRARWSSRGTRWSWAGSRPRPWSQSGRRRRSTCQDWHTSSGLYIWNTGGQKELPYNKVRNALVANRSVFQLSLTEKYFRQWTELNPAILKIFHVSQSVSDKQTNRQTGRQNDSKGIARVAIGN